MKFRDIPQFTREGSYQVNMPWNFLKKWLKEETEEMNMQLNPVFQRGHVWTEAQQIAYVEFALRGGRSGRIVYFNCPGWPSGRSSGYNEYVCVDGLQRITAILRFLDNEIPAFGTFYKDFEDKIPIDLDLIVNVNNLDTEKDVLQWYVDLNSCGTQHTDEEIRRVKDMIEKLEDF